MKIREIGKFLGGLVFGALIMVGLSVASAEWNEPVGPPVSNNAPAPLNVSNQPQIKGANLTLNSNNQNFWGLLVPFGHMKLERGDILAGTNDNRMRAHRFCERNGSKCFTATEVSALLGR